MSSTNKYGKGSITDRRNITSPKNTLIASRNESLKGKNDKIAISNSKNIITLETLSPKPSIEKPIINNNNINNNSILKSTIKSSANDLYNETAKKINEFATGRLSNAMSTVNTSSHLSTNNKYVVASVINPGKTGFKIKNFHEIKSITGNGANSARQKGELMTLQSSLSRRYKK
jgi:hypothetical protein